MTRMLLAAAGSLAAVCLAAAPAQAQQVYARGFIAPPGARTVTGQFSTRGTFGHHAGWSRNDGGHGCMDRDHCDRRGRRDRGRTSVIMDWYGGEWALYNNRSWDADSYNDWWHDRTDRSMPRWVTHNQGCSRMWYAGDTLRC